MREVGVISLRQATANESTLAIWGLTWVRQVAKTDTKRLTLTTTRSHRCNSLIK